MADAGLSRLAFAALVAGLGILLAAVVWGGSAYPGYDHARQFISELGATGAVTGPSVNNWGFVPNGLLITGFSLLAAWILRRSALAVTACVLLAANGVGMAGAGVYPCDFECSRSVPSTTALLHDLFGGLGYLCAILGVGLAALWARKSEAAWLAPLGVVVLIVSIVGFYGLIAEVELPGLFQRAMETALASFMLALGWALMKGLRASRQ
ncbi:MAG: DUF998 domain-containing protein [Brevundimonas sp.]|uniref:DUF998 domain-containing protein n=1 Tax=Brevundimonas sp. TaxID=1871086 RepID=UPI002ABB2A1E|nr:DUF998 domain-containing protein [Brevundimonas sp.]MDZ4113724.1 DUF998 domain-containing protein [Brevundimonas sp.]